MDRRGAVGSPTEQRFVSDLMSPFIGADSSPAAASLADLLMGPMLRGMAVTLA